MYAFADVSKEEKIQQPSQKMFRVSRSTSNTDFYPPTLKSRVHGRAVRFHEGNLGPRPLGVGNSMISGYGSPIARMLVNKDGHSASSGVGGESENMEDSQLDPTFTPYISASKSTALSILFLYKLYKFRFNDVFCYIHLHICLYIK